MKALFSLFFLIGCSAVQAASLTDALPSGTVVLFEITDMDTARKHFEASPLKDTLSQFDWNRMIMGMYEQALDEGNMDETVTMEPDELRAALEKNSASLSAIFTHVTGGFVFAIGDLQGAIQTFRETAEKREALYENVGMDADEPRDFQRMAEQEEALELEEMFAVLNEVYLLAEVQDGPGLMLKTKEYVEEISRQQTQGTVEIQLETQDWDGLPVQVLKVKELNDADDEEIQEEEDPVALSWWTVQDGIWVIRATEEGLRSTLNELKSPSPDRLSTDPAFQESVRFLGEQDTMLYVNFPRVDPLIRLSLGEETLNQSLDGTQTPAMILDWLGLDAMLPYAIGLTTDMDAIQGKGRFGFSRPTPLSRILIEPTDEPAPVPPFLHKEAGQVSSLHWGLGTGIRRLEAELTTLMPELAQNIAGVKIVAISQLGMDPQTQFLDHLGTGLLMVQQLDVEVMNEMLRLSEEGDMGKLMQYRMQHPTSGQNYLLALEVKNQEGLSSALNTLLSRVHPTGLPTPEMFQGHPIHFPLPQQGDQLNTFFSYTFLDGYLLLSIGDVDMLHDAVRASNEPSSRMSQDPEFLTLRDRFPAGAMFEYTPKSVQQGAWGIIESSLKASGLKLEGLPDLNTVGAVFGASYSTVIRKGTVFEARMHSSFAAPAE